MGDKMIGAKVKNLRTKNNYSLRKLAKETGLSHSFISDIEHDRCRPSINSLLVLAKALGVKPEFFLTSMVADSEHSKKAN